MKITLDSIGFRSMTANLITTACRTRTFFQIYMRIAVRAWVRKNRSQGRLAATLALSLALMGANAFALTFSGDGGTGQVVDFDTGEPVTGAGVLMDGTVFPRNGGGGATLFRMGAMTGADGKFTFPAWGPYEAVGTIRQGPYALELGGPALKVFRTGYLPGTFLQLTPANGFEGGWAGTSHRIAWFEAQPLRLRKAKNLTMEQRIGFTKNAGMSLYAEPECNWLNYPQWVAAVKKEEEAIKALPGYHGNWGMPWEHLDDLCPGGRAAVMEFLK